MVTNLFGPRCTVEESPYITNCHYSVAYDMLEYIADIETYPGDFNHFRFFSFPQPEAPSMAEKGYAHIPKACAEEGARCPVHVALHGCMQAIEFIGFDFVEFSGYNNVAEANDMIIPLAVNGIGMPRSNAGSSRDEPNISIRIPTRVLPGAGSIMPSRPCS